MKKIIVLLFSLCFITSIQAQGVMLLFGSDGATSPRDSVPNSYAFTDSIDAAVSTEILSGGVVLAGFDSAYVNVVGGDYRIGALGDTTRLATMIALGDTLWAIDTSSASNATKTDVIFTIGGVVDTFSVTTVAASGGVYTTDSLRLVYNDSDLSNGSVATWTDQIESFQLINPTDTTNRAIMTTGGLVFDGNDGYYRPISADPFPLITDAISIEVVVSLADTSITDAQIIFGIKCPNEMMLTLSNNNNSEGALHAWGYDYGDASGSQVQIHSIQNSLFHIVATFDGGTTTKIYINGVEQTSTGNSGGSTAGGDGVSLGTSYNNATAFLASGSIIRYAAIYAKVLTAQEVEDNYNSATIQGKLP